MLARLLPTGDWTLGGWKSPPRMDGGVGHAWRWGHRRGPVREGGSSFGARDLLLCSCRTGLGGNKTQNTLALDALFTLFLGTLLGTSAWLATGLLVSSGQYFFMGSFPTTTLFDLQPAHLVMAGPGDLAKIASPHRRQGRP